MPRWGNVICSLQTDICLEICSVRLCHISRHGKGMSIDAVEICLQLIVPPETATGGSGQGAGRDSSFGSHDMSEVEREIDRVVVQVDSKRNKREIQGKNFHDNKKDRAGR